MRKPSFFIIKNSAVAGSFVDVPNSHQKAVLLALF
jgi:hypothetical protein